MYSKREFADEVVVKCEESEESGGGGGEESSCLICLSSDTRGPQSWKQFWRPGEPLSLSRNLSTVFLLRNLLGVESGQVAALLSSTFGVEPGAWVRLCGECSETVRKAYQCHQECCKLQREIEAIGEGLRKEIGGSWNKHSQEVGPIKVWKDDGNINEDRDGGIVNVHRLIRDYFQVVGGEGGNDDDDAYHLQKDIISEPDGARARPPPTPPGSTITRSHLKQMEEEDSESSGDRHWTEHNIEADNRDSDSEHDNISEDASDSDHDEPARQPPTRRRQSQRLKAVRSQSQPNKTGHLKPKSAATGTGTIDEDETVVPCGVCNHPWECTPQTCSFQSEGEQIKVFWVKKEPGIRRIRGGAIRKMYSCKKCDKTFQIRNDVVKHVRRAHSNSNPKYSSSTMKNLSCPICHHKFGFIPSALLHMRKFHPGATLACPKCEFETARPCTYFKHEIEHKFKDSLEPVEGGIIGNGDDEDEVLLRCKLCGLSSGVWKKAVRHLKMKHLPQLGLASFPCPTCPMVFLDRTEMRKHLKLRHSLNKDGELITRTRDFKCHLCSSAYHAKDTLLHHVKHVHGGGEGGGAIRRKVRRSVQRCNACGAEFYVRRLLLLHMETEHPESSSANNPSNPTPDSSAKTVKTMSLNHPSASASLERKQCGKNVRKKKSLKKGQRPKKARSNNSSNPTPPVPPPSSSSSAKIPVQEMSLLKCTKCKEFTTSSQPELEQHLQQHLITDNFETVDELHARCSLCGNLCLTTGTRAHLALMNHLKSAHESLLGDQLFQCQDCDKWFSQRIGLTKHVLRAHSSLSSSAATTSSNGTFECQHCQSVFSSISQRNRHRKLAHTIHGATRCAPATHSCSKCDFTTKVKAAYIQHVQNHSLTLHFEEVAGGADGDIGGGGKFLCKLCGIRCSRMKRYAHLNQMHAQVIDLHQYQCHICGKGFNKMKNVKVHLAWHQQQNSSSSEVVSAAESEVVVMCELCGQQCTNTSQLEIHRRKFHSSDLKKPESSSCSQKIASSPSPPPPRQVKCRLCGLVDVPAGQHKGTWLSAHMKETHGELYKFSCELCDKRFLQQFYVAIHKEKVHFKERL